jgi:hypothetical protein
MKIKENELEMFSFDKGKKIVISWNCKRTLYEQNFK